MPTNKGGSRAVGSHANWRCRPEGDPREFSRTPAVVMLYHWARQVKLLPTVFPNIRLCVIGGAPWPTKNPFLRYYQPWNLFLNHGRNHVPIVCGTRKTANPLWSFRTDGPHRLRLSRISELRSGNGGRASILGQVKQHFVCLSADSSHDGSP